MCSSSLCSWPGKRYNPDAPILMLLIFISFVSRISDKIADAKTGSISIALAILTGSDGPLVSRNEIIFFFFSLTSIM